MTQKPEPPEKVDPEVPSVISDIILKLLNKNPEDRYQSAFGLMWDLKECKSSWMRRDISAMYQLAVWMRMHTSD